MFCSIRLALLTRPRQPQPVEIVADAFGVLFLRALAVGVVHTQNKRPAMLLGIQPIQRRGADIADVQAPCRAWRKTNNRGHQGLANHEREDGT